MRYDRFVMGVWAFWIGELQGEWWRRFTVEGRENRRNSRWKREVKLSARWWQWGYRVSRGERVVWLRQVLRVWGEWREAWSHGGAHMGVNGVLLGQGWWALWEPWHRKKERQEARRRIAQEREASEAREKAK